MNFDICSHLHAISDLTMSNIRGIDSKYHTNNAECYAEKCHRRGKCIIALTDSYIRITPKTKLKEN